MTPYYTHNSKDGNVPYIFPTTKDMDLYIDICNKIWGAVPPDVSWVFRQKFYQQEMAKLQTTDNYTKLLKALMAKNLVQDYDRTAREILLMPVHNTFGERERIIELVHANVNDRYNILTIGLYSQTVQFKVQNIG